MIKRKIKNTILYIDENESNVVFLKNGKKNVSYVEKDINNLYNDIYDEINEYIPLSVYIELTNSCNFFCPFCYVNCGNKSKMIDFTSIKKYINFLLEKGMIHCTLSGGECLLHPKFNEIYLILKKNGVLVTILTNGSLISDERLKLFEEYKPYKIEISLYGDSNDKYYINTLQKKYGFDNVKTNILKLKNSGINIICKMPVNAITESSFINVNNWCINKKIPFYFSDELFSDYNGISNEDLKLKNGEIKNLIEKDNNNFYKKLDFNLCRYKYGFDCTAGKYSLVISYDKKIFPCFEFRQIPNYIYDISLNIEYGYEQMIQLIKKYKDKIICNGCNAYSLCQDCIINKLNNTSNCQKYKDLRKLILNKREEEQLRMNEKYRTIRLETDRLIIDKGTSEDCIKIYEYDMLKCRGIAEEEKIELSKDLVDFIGPDNNEYYDKVCVDEKMFDWYIYLKSNNYPIGNVTADREIDEINSIELTFNMHPNYWRNGFMSEAVKKIINYLFDKGYDNIIMGYDDGNVKSKSFIEKLGAKFYYTKENAYQKNGVNISTTLMIISKESWKY